MKSALSKRFSLCPQTLIPSRCSSVGFLFVALSLVSPSSSAHAKPHRDDIQHQYQVLVPYKSQIAERLDSASSLIDHIFKQLKLKSLPANLVLVPMLESSYNLDAVSHANAAGLWQLIPATAIRFGLQVSSDNDQRFDAEASTQAALAYLAFLYQKFGHDITLTLAAYNAGEGRVARAIKRAGTDDFNLLTLPKETQQYVQRFYALEQLVDVSKLRSDSFQPLLLFSSPSVHHPQPLIDLGRLPPLIDL
ncbi:MULTISPECIES: lytic transglycosylase domain-containing protein [Vibrio]|uniref:lytic transglycosylase domain-containing protein n=1 Tax=Vibrio TaxID=662 RepID=UPI000E68B5E3|nr:lytic transglycosylase domain-containing protein [Vibrio sp. PID23_8]RIZ53527.1 lytic murein transglycosylase [Vibrio sp. PID23_8]